MTADAAAQNVAGREVGAAGLLARADAMTAGGILADAAAMTVGGILARADAILVDLDGTLVESTAPVRRAWGAFAQRNGLDADAVHRFAQGRPSRESIALLAPDADVGAETAAVEEAEVHDTAGVFALPGAGALLSTGRPLAIVTSCSTALAHARLRAARLAIPSVLVSSDGLERGTPDPACFLIAARRLGAEPARCVVIEDAPAGIRAGRAAGATVIAVRTTHADDELGDAHAIVDDVAALMRLAD
jgi:mannitol-1-/sugar-/sorbitol-6-phosphatase